MREKRRGREREGKTEREGGRVAVARVGLVGGRTQSSIDTRFFFSIFFFLRHAVEQLVIIGAQLREGVGDYREMPKLFGQIQMCMRACMRYSVYLLYLCKKKMQILTRC
jgi:hypothetical protein